MKPTDIHPTSVALYLLPVENRIPYRFGSVTATRSTCLRVRMEVEDRNGNRAVGWGESPLGVGWSWPGDAPNRDETMLDLCRMLAERWSQLRVWGHPIEVGNHVLEVLLPEAQQDINQSPDLPDIPRLPSLVCNAPFDLALHDAYGVLLGKPVYDTYNATFMSGDLSAFISPAEHVDISFDGLYPQDFLARPRDTRVPAWHSVGASDLLTDEERTGDEPDDGYPVVLGDWIRRDGITCLKIKLTGEDPLWDFERIRRIGEVAAVHDVLWLCTDFNSTVKNVEHVNGILDKLMMDHPRIYQSILYVEQPFPYDLEANPIDVHTVAARKPLMMDESAHDWRIVEMGRLLGWNSVALKTCKTLTGALLTNCWAKAHGMGVMVQDLTNPMLAQIAHVQLAANVGTMMGLESNSPQFYPDASKPEAAVHPGVFTRKDGCLDASTVIGPGIGYNIDAIDRTLPEPECSYSSA